MRRAIARGRIVPQSLSTDPRYGHLSLKAQVLYPLIWINCDDQGRFSGDPDEIKYAACPSVKDISAEEVPTLLQQMETKGMIKVYNTSKTMAIQMLDWWEEQKLQWAYPSKYPPPEGWTDHLRFHPTPTEIITENWPPLGRPASELLPSRLPSALPKELPSKQQEIPLTTSIENEKEEEKEKEGGKGRLPSLLPSRLGRAPPSPGVSQKEILEKLFHCHEKGWGKLPGGKISAQLRDLSEELSAAGCPLDSIEEAFREAAAQNKYSVSYVRAILLDWLGVPRGPPV